MGIEIERKFLVVSDEWKRLAEPVFMRQGYICSLPGRVVRVRIEADSAMLTMKGKSSGISRGEWEYAIPLMDAEELLRNLCEQPLIEKKRYRIAIDGLVWEVDEFLGDNAGLIIAEVELLSEEQSVILPNWVGEEVSHDHRYANANLFKHPYTRW
ncbi:CYTH domain-containing protein [Undibacterium amnicola]|uniref:CYTH domain-containing protein n=1 Tax=Undibacterium amnicola TaxID=1834038 RepID=A0ABR6XMV0_9BURK|nr:CYTH domain-containing protein [Undibacterium amnicola]